MMEIYWGLTKRVELLTYDLDMNETWAKHVTDFTTILTTWNKSLFANNILKFKKLIVHFKMLIFCKARNVIATVKVRRSVFLQFPKVTVTCPNWQILPGLSNTNSCAFWLRQIAIEIFCHFTKYFLHRDSLNLSCQNVQVLLLAKMFIPLRMQNFLNFSLQVNDI